MPATKTTIASLQWLFSRSIKANISSGTTNTRAGRLKTKLSADIVLSAIHTLAGGLSNIAPIASNIFFRKLMFLCLTSRPSTAGMEARIQIGALPAVGCAVLLAS